MDEANTCSSVVNGCFSNKNQKRHYTSYTSQTGHRKGMDYCGSHQKSENLIIKEMEHTSLRRTRHITLACPRDDENCPMGKKLQSLCEAQEVRKQRCFTLRPLRSHNFVHTKVKDRAMILNSSSHCFLRRPKSLVRNLFNSVTCCYRDNDVSY